MILLSRSPIWFKKYYLYVDRNKNYSRSYFSFIRIIHMAGVQYLYSNVERLRCLEIVGSLKVGPRAINILCWTERQNYCQGLVHTDRHTPPPKHWEAEWWPFSQKAHSWVNAFIPWTNSTRLWVIPVINNSKTRTIYFVCSKQPIKTSQFWNLSLDSERIFGWNIYGNKTSLWSIVN